MWREKKPSELSLDELAEARVAVQDRFDELQAELGWLGNALNHYNAEVAARYKMPVPGMPELTTLPEFPAEQIADTFKGYKPPKADDTADETSTGV